MRSPLTTCLLAACALVAFEPAHVEMQAVATAPAAVATNTDTTIRVIAVVTDGKGQPLNGLKTSDFELLVDGKPQALDSVELNSGITTPRAFALVLDEFHTAAGDSAAVREGLLRFVDKDLRPADVAVVIKPLDSLVTITPTADRDALRKAISTFEGRKGDYTPRTPFERNYMAQAPAAVASARAQIVTSALRAVGMTLSQKPDLRPAIVLVSDGFARIRTERDLPANLQVAVRVANRADAPVYAFAPALTPPAADGEGADPAFAALRALTTQTGGELFTGTSYLANGLAQMTRELDRHYVLTYRAAHGSDGRFHAVQVAVKRQGVQVRARAGYVAPMSPSMLAALTPAPAAPTRLLRRSPLIQSWSGVIPIEGNRRQVTLTWEPSMFTTLPRSTPVQRPRASSIVVTASTADGMVLFDGAVGPASEVPSPDVPNRAAFDAPTGAVRIDMKILDAKGVVIDTDARDVTLPVPRKDSPTIYAPAVLRARSAREFRDALNDVNAAPVANRDFRRTDRLLIRVPAFDTSGAPAQVNATILNRWRQSMRDLPAMAPSTTSALPGVTLFDLPLSSFAPGEYTIRLTVAHPTGTVSEHVTFRVAG